MWGRWGTTLYPPCQPGVQLFGAQKVEDGGENGGVPVDEDLRGRGAENGWGKAWGRVEILSLLLPAAPFQVSPYSRLRSHLSKSRCVRSGDCREGTQSRRHGPGWVRAHTFSSRPTPPPLTRSPNYLEKKESGIQVRVCREVLNLCGEK